MFCFQCQETLKNQGCQVNGVCGKKGSTADLQDLLIHTLKGISLVAEYKGKVSKETGEVLIKNLFTTITNVNFNDENIFELIRNALQYRDNLKENVKIPQDAHDSVIFKDGTDEELADYAKQIGVLSTENEDVRSLRELLIYGVKGIAAYADHALVLGKEDESIYQFVAEALASTTKELEVQQMIALVLKAGEIAVTTMALLDEANTSAYGHPELTEVNIGVKNNPGILISGHDLKDMEQLLEQTQGPGVDVYTHGEMLPANYYPAFKKYNHFVGNYGSSWWKQKEEFESFNGPILMTTNCLVPPSESYKERVFTTGRVSFPGMIHIEEDENGARFFSIN